MTDCIPPTQKPPIRHEDSIDVGQPAGENKIDWHDYRKIAEDKERTGRSSRKDLVMFTSF